MQTRGWVGWKKARPLFNRSACMIYRTHSILLVLGLVTACLLLGLYWTSLNDAVLANPQCASPSLRREWRTLDPQEQESYISSVQCLMHHPSIFQNGTSYYDDFIFAHSKTGSYSHYAAAFLPWHRLYMFLYEKALWDRCEYSGPFP